MILVASDYQILSVMYCYYTNTISKKLLILNFYLELQHGLDSTSNEDQYLLSFYQKNNWKQRFCHLLDSNDGYQAKTSLDEHQCDDATTIENNSNILSY